MENAGISVATLLRLKAEKLIANSPGHFTLNSTEGEILKLLHEMEVYNVELETQNEELLQSSIDVIGLNEKNKFSENIKQRLIHEFEVSKVELEIQNQELLLSNIISNDISERYSDLFNFSSSGYLILSKEGEILDLNFSSAKLLEKDRLTIKNSQFGFFVNEDDRSIFNDFLRSIFQYNSKMTCEVSLTLENSNSIIVQLSGILTQQEDQCLMTLVDITERKQTKKYRELTREILQLLNEPGDIKESIYQTLRILKERTGFDAVGIRLQEGDDFPYFDQKGFSTDFILQENSLIELDKKGEACRNKDGNVRLACTCGLVISGCADKTNPFMTPGGSWWINDSFPLLNIPPKEDVRYHPRNLCIHKGYASIALVPIRNKNKTVGLIQFNDFRKGVFNQNKIEFLEGIAMHIGSALMRKQAEETLRKNEELLRTITENAPDIIIQLDRHGAVLYMNRAWPGYSIEECAGKNFCTWTLPEYHDKMNQSLELVYETSITQTYLSRGIDIEGETRWYRTSISPVKDGAMVKNAILITRDITESILSEEILRESEKKRKTILMIAMDGFCISDRMGAILEVNDAYSQMVGYSRQELLTMDIHELEVVETAEDTASHIRKIMIQGEDRFETRHRCKDGHILELEVSVQFRQEQGGQFVTFLHDITERKRKEESLRQSEERYKSLFQDNHCVMLLIHPQTGEIVDANPTACNYYGWSHSELCSKNISQINTLSKEEIATEMQCAQEERRNHFFFKHKLASDEIRDVEVYSGPIRFGEETMLYSLVHDITERKQAEKELKISKDNLRVILDATLESIYLFDKDGCIVDANITAAKRLNRELEGIIGKNFRSLVAKENQENRLIHLQEVFVSGKPVQFEDRRDDYIFEHNFFPVFTNGKVEHVVSFSRDVTESRKMEDSLKESEKRYRELVKYAPTGIYEIDFKTAKFRTVNEAMILLTGYTREEFLSMNAFDILDEESKVLIISQMEGVLKGVDVDENVEYKIMAKNGTILYVILNLYIQYDDAGMPSFATVIVHDISERVMMEKALRASEEKLSEIYASMNEGLAIHEIIEDSSGKAVDYRLLEVNPAYERLTGIKQTEVTGRKVTELYSTEEAPYLDIYSSVASTGESTSFETYFPPMNQYFAISVFSPGRGRFATLFRDITVEKQATEALKISEQRLKYHFENSPLAVVEWDNNFIVTQWSIEAERIFGWKKEETLGKPIDQLSLIYEEDIPIVNNTMERLTSGTEDTVVSSNRNMTKTGSIIHTTWYNSILLDQNGKMKSVMSLVEDVTLRKHAEEELRSSESRLDAVFNSVTETIMLISLGGIVLAANQTASLRWGMSGNELIGKNIFSLLPAEAQKRRETQLQEMIATGMPIRFEDERGGIEYDLTFYPIKDTSGKIDQYVAFNRDVTESKRAQEALRRNEERYSMIYNSSRDSIFSFDLSGRLTGANRSFCEEINLELTQILGHDFTEIGLPEILSREQENLIRKVMETNNSVISELKVPTIDRTIRYYEVTLNPMHDEKGNIAGISGTARNISKRKEADQAILESEQRFRYLVKDMPVGVILFGSKGEVIMNNPKATELLGVNEDQVKDKYSSDEDWKTIHEDGTLFPRSKRPVPQTFEKGSAVQGVVIGVYREATSDYVWLLIDTVVVLKEDGSIRNVIATFIDITERKVKEEALRKLNQILAALSKSSQIMSQSSDEGDYLKKVCNIVVEDTDFAMVWIGYAEEDEARTIRPVASAGFNDNYLDSIKLSWADNDYGRGPTGVAIRTGEIGMCNNMVADPTFEPWREQALKRGYVSSIVFPLISDGKVFGVFTIYSNKTGSFMEDEIKFLSKLASDLTHGITTIRLRQARKLAEDALLKSHSKLEKTVKERTSELVKTNEALRLTEMKYRTVADFAANWEFWTSPEDRIIYCSPSCEQITGYSSTEFQDNSQLLFDIIHPEDLPIYRDHKGLELQAQACDHEIKYRIFKKDGTVRWIGHFCRPVYDESGNFAGTRGSNKDITSRKKMEELLTTSNQKYKLLSENINDGIFISKKGKFEYVNKAIYNIFGYKGHELERKKLTELVLTDYHDELENLLYTNATYNKSCNIEVECLRKDFTTVFAEIFLNYVAKEKTVYGVVHDITEKREFQKNMVKAIIQTEEKERSHFSKELHDGLGPLLSTIKLYLQWSERPNTNKSREEIIGKAGEILEEALATVKEVSNKLSPHLLTNYGLNSAIKSFVEKLSATASYNVIFESNTTRRIGMETEAALYRAIIECINNTLKYANASNIHIKLEDTGSQIQLYYKDDGTGFNLSEKIAEHKGLGLFNLQNRLHTIGGKVEMTSKPGEGVNYCFTVNV